MISFKRLIIYNTFKTVTIQWEMVGTVAPGSTFQAFWARDPQGDWTAIGTPQADVHQIVDTTSTSDHIESDVWYKVNLVPPAGPTVVSAATHLYNGLSKMYWLRWKVMLEKARLAAKRGMTGTLRRRRWWGTKCPVCLDHDTELPTKEFCTTCYGTGYSGGYWPALDCNILVDTADLTVKEGEAVPESVIVLPARVPAVSLMDTDDIWIDRVTGTRWRVDEVKQGITIGSMTVIYQATLYQLRTSDVIYELI